MSKEAVLRHLDDNDIPYEIIEHRPIFTITELYEMEDFPNKDKVAKNLFLRNDNGKQHYLLVVRSDKTVDLKDLRKQIGSSRLGFASEERLNKYLNLTRGSVTPLAVINDSTRSIPVIIDSDLKVESRIGVHPNINTATVWLSHDQLVKAVESHGSGVQYVEIH